MLLLEILAHGQGPSSVPETRHHAASWTWSDGVKQESGESLKSNETHK